LGKVSILSFDAFEIVKKLITKQILCYKTSSLKQALFLSITLMTTNEVPVH